MNIAVTGIGYVRRPQQEENNEARRCHSAQCPKTCPETLFRPIRRAIASKLADPYSLRRNADRSACPTVAVSGEPMHDHRFRGQEARFQFRCVRPGPIRRAIASKLADPYLLCRNADRSACPTVAVSGEPMHDHRFRGQEARFQFRCVRPGPIRIWSCIGFGNVVK